MRSWHNPNYREINVTSALNDENSVLHFYRDLIALRNKSDILKYGTFELLSTESPYLFAFMRKLSDKRVYVMCNFSGTDSFACEYLQGDVLIQSGIVDNTILPFGYAAVEI